MHGLRLGYEPDGNRAQRYRPRFADVHLRALQKGPAAHHRIRRDGGLDRPRTCRERPATKCSHPPGARRVHGSQVNQSEAPDALTARPVSGQRFRAVPGDVMGGRDVVVRQASAYPQPCRLELCLQSSRPALWPWTYLVWRLQFTHQPANICGFHRV
jgi:hypothetical protein